MARATYSAPGVYVEEVPSAQQPIAGVGTSTAAFIGHIPGDEIEFPELNEKYDPVLAKRAKGIPGKGGDGRLNDYITQSDGLKQELKDAKNEKGENEKLADQPDPANNAPNADQVRAEKANAVRRVAELDERIAGLQAEKHEVDENIKQLKDQLEKLPEKYKNREIRCFKLGKFPDVTKGEKMIPALQAKLCTNFSEYARWFGGFSADEPNKPGTPKYPGHRALTHAVNGFFQNGGRKCFVVRIKNETDLEKALELIESIDAVAIVAAPGLPATTEVWQKLQDHCATCEDRFAVLDSPAEVENKDVKGEVNVRLLSYDTPNNKLPPRDKNSAYYFPYIKVTDPAKQLQDQDIAREVELKDRGAVYVAPSGHIAGIYSRTDKERGVHKAPANVIVRGAIGIKYYVGRPRQGSLNPQGVNCIRDLNGAITVWGARTVGGDKNGEWKYVSVRRLFLFMLESIDEGTQWVVFEPNDRALWGKIRRNVSAFLTNVWRSGALFGSSPQEAFYVRCDDATNPPEVRDAGRVVTEIGVSIVRPAEFVIFRITQSTEGGNA